MFQLSLCLQMVVVDVYNSRFHRVYYDNDNLQSIMERDDIYMYVCLSETPLYLSLTSSFCSYELQKSLGDPDWVPVPVYHRELK